MSRRSAPIAFIIWILAISYFGLASGASAKNAVVVDAVSGEPLSGVSVFNRKGDIVGVSSSRGLLPYIAPDDYPLTVRCLGYTDVTGITVRDSVISLEEFPYELFEVVVAPEKRQVLHVLAFAREYSTLCTYSDTVTLFREKWIDYMLPTPSVKNFKGWLTPRTLTTKSYYQFRNNNGLDSVSDRFNQHFSWSDWIGLLDRVRLPEKLASDDSVAIDTVFGKYRPTQIWSRKGEDVTLRVNVLSDTLSRSLIPGLSSFFNRDDTDFEKLMVDYMFADVTSDMLFANNISRISANIESRGRGRNMFMFNKALEPFFVTTYIEIFIVDKEYMSEKEARKCEKIDFSNLQLPSLSQYGIIPPLSPQTIELIARVEGIDHTAVRLNITPDQRLIGLHPPQKSWERIFNLTKKLVTLQWVKAYFEGFRDMFKQ